MRAPLEIAALERVLLPFGPCRLLPQEAYTTQAVLDWEKQHFFAGSWVCVGRADGLAKPGDQRAVRVGKDGVLLLRGDDDRVRGFFNVCRHRAHELLQAGECTNDRMLRCPYHGWTYNLDGSLHPSVRSSHVAEFEPAREGLVPAAVEEWGGWVFVNPSGDAPPMADWLGELVAFEKPYESERLQVGATHAYDIAANWKLIAENYHECYHCPRIHPQLCKVSPPDSGEGAERHGAFVGGSMDLADFAQTMSMDGSSKGVMLRKLSAELRRQVFYYHLFPNVLLSFHPDYIMTHRMEPLSPSVTHVECQWLFAPESLAQKDFDPSYAVDFWDVTNRQDWAAVESVQRRITSRGYVPGTLTPREENVYQFVTRVARGYLDGRFAPVPRSATVA